MLLVLLLLLCACTRIPNTRYVTVYSFRLLAHTSHNQHKNETLRTKKKNAIPLLTENWKKSSSTHSPRENWNFSLAIECAGALWWYSSSCPIYLQFMYIYAINGFITILLRLYVPASTRLCWCIFFIYSPNTFRCVVCHCVWYSTRLGKIFPAQLCVIMPSAIAISWHD